MAHGVGVDGPKTRRTITSRRRQGTGKRQCRRSIIGHYRNRPSCARFCSTAALDVIRDTLRRQRCGEAAVIIMDVKNLQSPEATSMELKSVCERVVNSAPFSQQV